MVVYAKQSGRIQSKKREKGKRDDSPPLQIWWELFRFLFGISQSQRRVDLKEIYNKVYLYTIFWAVSDLLSVFPHLYCCCVCFFFSGYRFTALAPNKLLIHATNWIHIHWNVSRHGMDLGRTEAMLRSASMCTGGMEESNIGERMWKCGKHRKNEWNKCNDSKCRISSNVVIVYAFISKAHIKQGTFALQQQGPHQHI